MRFSLFATLAFLAFSNAAVYNYVEDSWSFDLGRQDYSSWMSKLRDDVSLSRLVIPGTHGSMTDDVENSLFQTQNVPLDKQLLGGIRYIEITCRYEDDEMAVYHGNVDTGYGLDGVLTTIYDFLDQNPRETIILRIQKGGIVDSDTFLDCMEEYFLPGSELGYRAIGHIYAWNHDDETTLPLPTLGEARGKVLILQDFKSSPPGLIGFPWDSSTVSSHSSGLSPMGLFLRYKWAKVKYHISLDRLEDYDKLRITHTTANGGIEPIRVAAQNGDNPGMNEFLGRYLIRHEGECFGIIVMDFPGRYLVEQILKRNNHNILPDPISLSDQNAIDAADFNYTNTAEGGDFNDTSTAEGADVNNESTAQEADFNAAGTAEEFDFNSISDFEPPSPEDSADEYDDDDYSDYEYTDDEYSDH